MVVCVVGLSGLAMGSITESEVDYWAQWTAEGGWEVNKDVYGFGSTFWLIDPPNEFIRVPNREVLTLDKIFWLEITWSSGLPGEDWPWERYIKLMPADGEIVTFLNVSRGIDDWTWKWQIHPQPAYETAWVDQVLTRYPVVSLIEVASKCIPEPTTIAIWALLSLTCGGFGLRFWQRNRRPGLYPSLRAPWSNEARMSIHQIIEQGRMR